MAKVDPRADPISAPPTAKDDFSVDRVVVPKAGESAGFLDSSVVPVGDSGSAREPVETVDLADGAPPAVAAPRKVTSQDPRYEPLEKLLDANDWRKIATEVGPLGEVGKLPPNLGLVAAVAHNENAKEGDPEAAAVAIRCMAGLLGVAEDSAIARVLARRLLRKNPVRMRDREAPAARTSLLIVLVTLIVGGGVGWLASLGSWRAIAQLLHLR